MPRLLNILKYLPAVLCGLLVVAWAVSAFVPLRTEIAFPFTAGWLKIAVTGRDFDCYGLWNNRAFCWASAPIMFAALLPFSIGPFTRFRFPLWSWFAFTALVAVELAYYLR